MVTKSLEGVPGPGKRGEAGAVGARGGVQPVPSVKGTTLGFLVDEAKAGLESGALPESAVTELSADTRGLLQHGVLPAAWYAVGHYDELGEWLARRVGDRIEYLRGLGARDFERLQKVTTYQQVAYVDHVQQRRDVMGKLRDSRLITSMMAAVFNFSHWSPQPDPDSPRHIVIEVRDATLIPECFRFLTEGFQTAMNRTINPQARAVRSERVSEDVILFRTNGPRP